MKKFVVILIAALALIMCVFASGSARGGTGVQMAIVPADALWVLHLNMGRLTSSVMFKMITEERGQAEMQLIKGGQFLGKLKIDPLKDIQNVTVFGRGKDDEDAVVAISGKFDKPYLLGLVKAETTHKEIPYGKYTLYNWDSDEFGVFAADDLILLSEDEGGIKLALDAMEGKVQNIMKSPQFGRLIDESRGAILVAATNDLSGLAGSRGGPVMLTKMKNAAGSLTEVGELMNIKIDISTESAQVAKEIEQAVRGLIAIVNLQVKDADALALTQKINIAVDGENVRVDAAYPTLQLVQLMKKRGHLPHVSLDKFGPLSYY
jgi:hypothetical protein